MFMNIYERFPYPYEYVYFTYSYLGRIFGREYVTQRLPLSVINRGDLQHGQLLGFQCKSLAQTCVEILEQIHDVGEINRSL